MTRLVIQVRFYCPFRALAPSPAGAPCSWQERHSGPLLPAGAQVCDSEVMDALFLN